MVGIKSSGGVYFLLLKSFLNAWIQLIHSSKCFVNLFQKFWGCLIVATAHHWQTAVPSSSCELPPLLPGRRKPKQEGKGALSQKRQWTPLKIYEKLLLAPWNSDADYKVQQKKSFGEVPPLYIGFFLGKSQKGWISRQMDSHTEVNIFKGSMLSMLSSLYWSLGEMLPKNIGKWQCLFNNPPGCAFSARPRTSKHVDIDWWMRWQ